MKRMYVLYNPLSGDKRGLSAAHKVSDFFPDREFVYQNITAIEENSSFYSGMGAGDEIVICGGDGTLNHFINDAPQLGRDIPVYYFATGNGNDFLRDIGGNVEDGPVQINQYIQNLPTVTVNNKTYRFLNGVGYGIDGYCCEVGDALRIKGKKPDYTSIAIKGLLFHYKPTNATVTVDGKKYTYKKVWIAPTMNGRYYGGGMMPLPDQDRNHPENGVGVMLMHGSGKLRTLAVFPSLFSGKHTKHKKIVAVHRGQDITVAFDRPVSLQIDGETILNVSQYRAQCACLVKK